MHELLQLIHRRNKMSDKEQDMLINKELEDAKWEDFDAAQEVKVNPELKWGEGAILLKLDPEMLNQISLISQKKGKIATQSLIKLWIAERIIDEMAHLKKAGLIS